MNEKNNEERDTQVQEYLDDELERIATVYDYIVQGMYDKELFNKLFISRHYIARLLWRAFDEQVGRVARNPEAYLEKYGEELYGEEWVDLFGSEP